MKHITLAEIEVGKTYTLTYSSGATCTHHIIAIMRSESGRYKYTCDWTERNPEGEITFEKKGYTKRKFQVGTKDIWHY